jgi:shikimate 5-dehydrogenase
MTDSRKSRILFIGVSTKASRIIDLFPRWVPLLGTSAQLVGHDLPLDADREQYRHVVQTIAAQGDILGAVITSHKLNLLAASYDLFQDLDPLARLTHESNAISKQDGLVAHARDPQAVAKALDDMLGPGTWPRANQQILCFGAGGAATAIALALLTEEVNQLEPVLTPRRVLPATIHFVDIRPERLAALQGLARSLGASRRCEFYLHSHSRDNDALLRSLPNGSLIINATGMGKDLPGAPVSRDASFPPSATVWDLNYRGELAFLSMARAQTQALGLSVFDGWRYFLHGWMQALQPILGIELDDNLAERLEAIATLES